MSDVFHRPKLHAYFDAPSELGSIQSVTQGHGNPRLLLIEQENGWSLFRTPGRFRKAKLIEQWRKA